MRACVIFNAAAGRRRSLRRLVRFRERWQAAAEFWPTQSRGHAEQLALAACQQGFNVVAAAGGDGTVHEVANGLLMANAGDVTLAVVPIGSANDYAYSLARRFGASSLDDESGDYVDVGAVTASGGSERFFVESAGLGLSAGVTLESQRPSRLQGKALYALALCRALRNHRSAEVTLQYDDDPPSQRRIMILSAMLGNREGGFSLAPGAQLDDGLLDVVSAALMTRLRVLSMLPRIALFGLPARHPQVSLRRCRVVTVHADAPLVAHTDGEMFCTSANDVHELIIRVLPSRLRVKLCPP